MAEGLQDHRAGGPRRQRVALVDVDAPVLEVGDRVHRNGQVLNPVEREPVVGDEGGQGALGHRAPLVAGGAEGLGGRKLDLAEVVVARPHLGPQAGVGRPGALRRRRLLL